MDVSFPPLSNWQDFEELTVGLFEEVHGVFHPQRYGLQGQPQHGVDVIGQSGSGEWLAAQCKRLKNKGAGRHRTGGAISERLLRAEIAKADGFSGKIDRYLLVTTGSTQPEIQTLAQHMTAERKPKGLFAINVLFWEDFDRSLNRNGKLSERFLSKLLPKQTPEESDREILELIASSFRRPAFRDHLNIEHRENFKHAIRDVLRAIDTGTLVNRDGGVERSVRVGYAGISDSALRKQCRRVRDELDAFKSMLLDAERERLVEQQGEWLNISSVELRDAISDARDKCVRSVNALLAQFNIEPV